MEIIVALVVGLAVGGLTCWLVQEFRSRARLSRGAELTEEAKAQQSDAFRALASAVLRENTEQFLNVANQNLGKTLESAKGEFNQRHEQFQALVKPLTEDYAKLNPQIDSLIRQSNYLAAETSKLSSALTDSRQIGSWGEIQLRRIVELAGMTEHCDFVEQTTASGSRDRPDLTVRLPERRTVVVDAKASTAAFMEAQLAEDTAEGEAALSRHAGALRTQVDDLARKDYGRKVEGALDFVVMFVPGDQFLAAALSANPKLIEYAMGKRVAIATPASLISLLWTVANGWQRHQIAENAEEILNAGQVMHERMMKFIEHYAGVGKELGDAVRAYNRSVSSFDSRVVPQGRKFAQLRQADEDSFGPPSSIEAQISTSRYADNVITNPHDGQS